MRAIRLIVATVATAVIVAERVIPAMFALYALPVIRRIRAMYATCATMRHVCA